MKTWKGSVCNIEEYVRMFKNKHDSIILVKKRSPITGLDRPRGFQEVKVPRFRDRGVGWW
jgi:hypothetical protein